MHPVLIALLSGVATITVDRVITAYLRKRAHDEQLSNYYKLPFRPIPRLGSVTASEQTHARAKELENAGYHDVRIVGDGVLASKSIS